MQASSTIFSERNPAGSHMADSEGRLFLDLHGLHASEAKNLLRHQLSALKQLSPSAAISSASPRVLHILAGTGHHTKGARTPARLPLAVEEVLASSGMRYSVPQPGLFEVAL